MPVEFKDYYATLGISRDAKEAEIKKAFRSLARKYHPDVAQDKKAAEAKFKEINEAHEVLSDPEKRRKYDELGANWQGGDFQPPPGGFRRGYSNAGSGGGQEFHFGGTGFSDFFEQFFGGGRSAGGFGEMFREGRMHAEGDGAEQFGIPGQDVEGDILVTLDEAMHGSLRSISLQRVNPQTRQAEVDTFKVRIPPGAQEGRRIRVPAKGGPGRGGGAAGDLFLRIRLAAHPDFRVRGSDLYHDVDLAPWECVLGTQVTAPTLTGSIKLRIPPGTNNGQQLRVRGQGLPLPKSPGERGDLYVVAQVQMPPDPTGEERTLWEKLAKTSTFNPRAEA